MLECNNQLLRVLLAHDGSMTYALEAIVNSRIMAKVVLVQELDSCSYLNLPVIQRETILESNNKQLVYAISYICKSFYTEMGFGQGIPIGAIMKNQKIAQFRDIYSITYSEIDENLASVLKIPQQKLFKKSYYIYINGVAKLHITEIFLPDLITTFD